MTINVSMPVAHELKPRITVVGVGGAGGNAVNNMITSHLEGVEFVVANTDAQVLAKSLAERRIQLGVGITHGLGAGARPEIGRAAAEEVLDEILDELQGSHMVFITAGMGGGTGTGAAPVIARAVREAGILTVAVVTKPFQFEGQRRMRLAEAGLEELQQYVDTLIAIPNQNLFRIANERTTFAEAFGMADQVLHMGVRGVTDLMVMPGLINLDFNDIRTVMSEMGKAMMGTGESEGEHRAVEAAEAAISNPLLDEVSMKGACGVLINITGGSDMTLFEVDEAANRIKEEVDGNANIIVGSTLDDQMQGRMRVSVVATGIDAQNGIAQAQAQDDAARMQPSETQHPAIPSGPQPYRFQPRVHKVTPPPFPAPGRSQPSAQGPITPAESGRGEHASGFVAPQPVDPGYQRESAGAPVVPAQWSRARPSGREDGRVPSLFERMTAGFGRVRQQQEHHDEPARYEAEAGGESEAPGRPQSSASGGGQPSGEAGAPQQRHPAASHAQSGHGQSGHGHGGSGQSGNGQTRTVERVPAAVGDDEVYDIPTFLRR